MNPQVAGFWMKGRTLGITLAIRPDFGSICSFVNKWIVERYRAIGADADYIAPVDGKILRSVPLTSFAHCDEEISVAGKYQSGAKMPPAVTFWSLPEDDFYIIQAIAGNNQTGTRYRRTATA